MKKQISQRIAKPESIVADFLVFFYFLGLFFSSRQGEHRPMMVLSGIVASVMLALIVYQQIWLPASAISASTDEH